MPKQGEEYERFVQDVYKVLNANDGLSDVVVQHNVKLKGISREHQIDVYWQFSYGTVTYRVAVECKDYKNPVTAEKIEAFRSTLLDIGNICIKEWISIWGTASGKSIWNTVNANS